MDFRKWIFCKKSRDEWKKFFIFPVNKNINERDERDRERELAAAVLSPAQQQVYARSIIKANNIGDAIRQGNVLFRE